MTLELLNFLQIMKLIWSTLSHGNIVGGKTISKNVYQVPAANFLKFYDNKLKFYLEITKIEK